MSTETHSLADANETVSATNPEPDAPLVETHPTTKPTLAWLVATLLVGVTAIAAIMSNPDALGDRQVAEVVVNLVLLLTVIGIVRLLIRLYVLTRTRYVVTPSAIRREYELLYRTWSRELPLSMLRGHELRRSRLQTLLGLGTVAFLSGSVGQGLGHLTFDHLSNPETVRDIVREAIDRAADADRR